MSNATVLASIATGGPSGSVLSGQGIGSPSIWAATTPISVPQTVQCGSLGSDGYPACIGTGTGLAPTLLATASAVNIAFAFGYGTGGEVDYIGNYSVDTAFPAVPANNTSFLYCTKTGNSLSLGSTLAVPQYGSSFNVYKQSAQSKLDLNNSITDDFGNAWTNNNVTFSNTNPAYVGTYMGVFNGTSSYMQSTAFKTMGQGNWTIRCKCKPAALPSDGNLGAIANFGNSVAIGVWLGIYNNSGSIKFVYTLSSNGTGSDIANSSVGITTPVVGTSYDVELTFDGSAYRLYVNGVQESSTLSSLKVCPVTSATIGINTILSANRYFNGSIQGFEFLPYCLHPAGTAFTPPTTLADITASGYASDFYNITTRKMYHPTGPSTVAGNNPNLGSLQRVYIGEVVTGANSVSNAISYAYNRKYVSQDTAIQGAGIQQNFNHNLGVSFGIESKLQLINQTPELGYLTGYIVNSLSYGGGYGTTCQSTVLTSRNSAVSINGSTGTLVTNLSSGVPAGIATANWKQRMTVSCNW